MSSLTHGAICRLSRKGSPWECVTRKRPGNLANGWTGYGKRIASGWEFKISLWTLFANRAVVDEGRGVRGERRVKPVHPVVVYLHSFPACLDIRIIPFISDVLFIIHATRAGSASGISRAWQSGPIFNLSTLRHTLTASQT